MSFSTILTQYFPPEGTLTEANLPSQAGRVFVVTGGSNGLGYELARQLYGAKGKVYILTRSKERTEKAISRIQAHYALRDSGKPRGSLEYIFMDLLDLETVRAAAQVFLEREGPDGRLDVLFNNAGAGPWKDGPLGRQGHQYNFTTNVLGPFLLTRLLSPILSRTAEGPGSVRVIWPGSVMIETTSPATGVPAEFLEDPGFAKTMSPNELYASTKAASYFLASEFARRQADGTRTGVIHLAGNPGNYDTGAFAHTPRLVYLLARPLLRDPSPHGADTWLWMGFSDEVTLEDAAAGRYVMCNGRWHPGHRDGIVSGIRRVEEGGSGRASDLYDWCERIVVEFLR